MPELTKVALRRLRRRLRTLLRRADEESELEAELRTHLDLEAEDLIRRGVPVEEAQRQAAISFGGLQQVKEEALDERTVRWSRGLWRDLRIAARALRRQPTFAIAAVLALALAIAVNTTMFSVVEALLNPDIGLRHPERLLSLKYYGDPNQRFDPTSVERTLKLGGRTYDAHSGWFPNGTAAVERGESTRLTVTYRARADLFSTLGSVPVEGTLTPGADVGARGSAVVISERLRAQLFPDRQSAVGEHLRVDGRPVTVIGVVTRNDITAPLAADLWQFAGAEDVWMVNLLRLRDGATLEDARLELAELARRIALASGPAATPGAFVLAPIQRQFRAGRLHVVLMGATIAVLLVACTNLANLQLARGLGRASELALRSSLGATRRQIVTQLVLESAVLAGAGLVLALLLAFAGNAIARASIPPQVAGYIIEPRSSPGMLLFAVGTAAVCLLLSGLVPALHVSRVNLNEVLKSRAGTGVHRRTLRVHGGLVALQIALTMPLLFAGAQLTRMSSIMSGERFLVETRGYDPTQMVTALVVLGRDKATTSLADLMNEAVRRARAIPGVVDAAASFETPVWGGAVTVDGPDGAVREIPTPMFKYTVVTPGYFRTYDFPIASGANLAEGSHDQPLALLDEHSAASLWPYTSPLQRRLKLGGARSEAPWITVTGTVGNRLSAEERDRSDQIAGSKLTRVYRVLTVGDNAPSTRSRAEIWIDVRVSDDPDRVAAALRLALANLGSRPPETLRKIEWLGGTRAMVQARFASSLASVFAVLALGLSALGVYGIVVQSITDRKREIAVRLALGASARAIVRALLREGNVYVLCGLMIGLMLTLVVGRALGTPLGWGGEEFVLAAACVGVFLAMAVAGLLPALRAGRIEPMSVLRAE